MRGKERHARDEREKDTLTTTGKARQAHNVQKREVHNEKKSETGSQ